MKILAMLWADLDRPANGLTIRASRVRSVRIYVTEGLFDLARPVTLRFGSRTWKGAVRPSTECMLRHYFDDRDSSAIVYNEIDFTAAGRVVAKYKEK